MTATGGDPGFRAVISGSQADRYHLYAERDCGIPHRLERSRNRPATGR